MPPSSPAGSEGGAASGNSPFPTVLQDRSPTTGALAVGWGNSPATSQHNSPSPSFKRKNVGMPNLVAAAAARANDGVKRGTPNVSATPSTRDVIESAVPANSPVPTERAADDVDMQIVDIDARLADIDQQLIAVVQEQEINISETVKAVEALKHSPHSPRSPMEKRKRRPSGEDLEAKSPSGDDVWRSPMRETQPTAASAEWVAQKRHAHADRLLKAAARASSRAAASKMIAMATSERLRTSTVLDEEEAGDAEAWRRPHPAAARLKEWCHEERAQATKPLKVTDRACGWEEDSAPSHELVPVESRVEGVHVQANRSPWEWFVRGLHAALGCHCDVRDMGAPRAPPALVR